LALLNRLYVVHHLFLHCIAYNKVNKINIAFIPQSVLKRSNILKFVDTAIVQYLQ